MWQKCIERARLAQRIMTNCATPHTIYMDNAEYWITARGVTRLDDSRSKKQVWLPDVRTWGLSEANVLHWRICDIVRTFRCPRSHSAPSYWFGARGIVPVLPCRYALITARSDAPQQTIVLSSNQRLTGTFGFRGAKFSIRPNFCATVKKTNRKVLKINDSA